MTVQNKEFLWKLIIIFYSYCIIKNWPLRGQFLAFQLLCLFLFLQILVLHLFLCICAPVSLCISVPLYISLFVSISLLLPREVSDGLMMRMFCSLVMFFLKNIGKVSFTGQSVTTSLRLKERFVNFIIFIYLLY